MSSDAQNTANRRNASRSTGPRTRAGKVASSRNARKHGLASSVLRDRLWSPLVWRHARAFASAATEYQEEDLLDLAAAAVDLMRIQEASTALWNRAIAILAPGEMADGHGQTEAERLEIEALACLEILPELYALERYERRAHVCWKRQVALLMK